MRTIGTSKLVQNESSGESNRCIGVSLESLWFRHWESTGTQREGNILRCKPLPED
jgi:hypothetical protein